MLRNLFRNDSRSAIGQMSVSDLKAKLDAREPIVLIDVRQPEEFAQDGHVAGARLLPLGVLPTRASELDLDAPIVIVCRSGSRSQVACEILQRSGFSNITNVAGGMIAWQQAGLPSKRG